MFLLVRFVQEFQILVVEGWLYCQVCNGANIHNSFCDDLKNENKQKLNHFWLLL